MIDEHDPRLQRIFDERLLRVLPPPRAARRRSAGRFVAASLAVLLTAGSFAFAADVNSTATAAGLSCTDVLAKVEIWWESVKNGTIEEQHQFKDRVAGIIGQTCDSSGKKAPAPDKAVIPAGEKTKEAVETNPACLAAEERAKEMIRAVPTMTRAQELELKQRINEMLAVPCQSTK